MAENLYGFARGINYDAAVLTMLQVALKFAHKFGVKLAVDVFRDFIDDLSASHCGHPFRNTWSGNAKTKTINVPAVLIEQGNESVRIARLGRGHDGLLVV
jgi:hypothetical protein